jgi:hypothetical protein
MSKRYGSLWVVLIGCLPAASGGAEPAAAPPANAPAASVERTGLIPNEQRRSTEFETAFPDDAIVRFGEGDDRAIGVYRNSIDEKALGVVVVVLGSGLSPDAHVDSTSLRRLLPRSRWSTLTVALPDIPNETLPPRQHDKFVEGAAAPPPADPGAAKPPAAAANDQMPTRVRARLDAAVKAARAKGSKVVLLGEESAGAWIVWAQNQGLGADAIVAINTGRNQPRIDGKVPKDLLATLKSPTLLLMETPLDWSVDDRLAPDVVLRLLPPGNPSGARLDRQIRGWLKRNFDSRG